MEKIKSIYIICFILQVISFPVIGYLLDPIIETTFYHRFYCDIEYQNPMDIFGKNFKNFFQIIMIIIVMMLHFMESNYMFIRFYVG